MLRFPQVSGWIFLFFFFRMYEFLIRCRVLHVMIVLYAADFPPFGGALRKQTRYVRRTRRLVYLWFGKSTTNNVCVRWGAVRPTIRMVLTFHFPKISVSELKTRPPPPQTHFLLHAPLTLLSVCLSASVSGKSRSRDATKRCSKFCK